MNKFRPGILIFIGRYISSVVCFYILPWLFYVCNYLHHCVLISICSGRMGLPDHSGQVRQIIWTSIQRLLRCDPRRPPVPQCLQRSSGFHHLTLCDSGGANQGCHGGTWIVDTSLGGVFLCQRWNCCIKPTLEAK